MEKSIKKTAMTTEEQNKADEIRSNLAYCTGTENYARYQIGRITYLITDGIRTMAEMCGAYWLIDLIVSHQNSARVRREPFQVWTLKPSKTTRGAMARADDGNGNKIAAQRIPYTDFPLPEGIKIYLADNVIMLPSEY